MIRISYSAILGICDPVIEKAGLAEGTYYQLLFRMAGIEAAVVSMIKRTLLYTVANQSAYFNHLLHFTPVTYNVVRR